jgi:hypothetical protein
MKKKNSFKKITKIFILYSFNLSYKQKHILIHDPKTGYNTIADQYKTYWKHLDSFDKGVFVKYLPKQKNISLIDL